ncbi:RNA dependent RNA polymerase-domain-containing protein [Thelonectria olida]|uniref:RNA-dependent RNA polymerase n=1 Tax=Thelonectria olida TaxID=1576542 RepID=A0A9P8W5Q4_9HYPO|nr:RNA dependent RNA polymerase-domain-containing protein [Thelonectria olida]
MPRPPFSYRRPQRLRERHNAADRGPTSPWQTWPELSLRLDDLPPKVTTANLWQWFSHEGEIVFLEIFEGRDRAGTPSARIKFDPPPRRAFWETGSYNVPHNDGRKHPNGFPITISVWKAIPQCSIQSPVSADRHYPIKTGIHPLALQFGSLVDFDSMKVMKSISVPAGGNSLRGEVNLKLKLLTAYFPIEVQPSTGHGKYMRSYKVVIDFSKVRHAFQSSDKDQNVDLVVSLKTPPRYYWRRRDVERTFEDDAKSWDASEVWNRATDIVHQVGSPLKHPLALYTEYNDSGFIDIGRWTTIRLILGPKGDGKIEQLINSLDDFGVVSGICDGFTATQAEKPQMWNLLEYPRMQEANALHLLALSTSPVTQVSFEVQYQLEVCISRGLLDEHSITVDFLKELASADPTKARLMLEFVADQDEPVKDPMYLFQNPEARSNFPDVRVPYYCALMRKAVITPTTIRFSTPTVEMSNRVLRRYNNTHDRFLRIQFAEEGEQGRIKVNKDQNDEIWKRMLRTLYQGIRIGERVYEFLAFGSSQLRQSGAYFFCPTEHISCDDIRQWMGNFDHIKVVAKYSARLGQCLSTTREIRGINVPTIRPIPDIERNGYCFTDGVGKISPFVAQMVIEDMHLDIFERPSLFQFRMGGCKGVLTAWPDAKGTEVHVRASQKKFKSEFNGLEIIRCARFATATLNRQTITILESLGVPIPSFVGLLDQQLRAYERAMHDNAMAIEMLRKLVDENQTTLAIAELLEAGFKTDEVQEPFVVNILNLWRSWSLKLLKEKARIHVERSAFLLGCVDETGSLRGHSCATEGSGEKDVSQLPQIFIQITDCKEYDRTTVIKGVCLVGRNPSLHPGDIRIVEAVDEPKLHHLKDVVVFPSGGDRPVPNMLSGGDLDGDDFFVMWDQNLMPRVWNHPPMDYTGSKPEELDRDVNVDDLRDFFVKYMKNDRLPLIAVSHLAMADKFGPASPICRHSTLKALLLHRLTFTLGLELANLHSQAVDYPKTGKPAVLRRNQQPQRWPHFMEKRSSYHSDKALGVIYDKVVHNCVQFKPIWDSPFDRRIIKHETIKPNAELLKAARQIKAQYDTSVRRLLSQYDLQTEFELWTGFALSKPIVGSDYKRQEDLGHEFDVLRQRFRELCYEAAGGKHTEMIDRFVAAMYIVTEEETKAALYTGDQGPGNDEGRVMQAPQSNTGAIPMISFPWIFHWAMIRLAGGKDKSRQSSQMPIRPKGTQRSVPLFGEEAEDASLQNNIEATELVPPDLGGDVQAHLPDGTVIHQGQPLTLFDDPEVSSPGPSASDDRETEVSGGHGQASNDSGQDSAGFNGEDREGTQTAACETLTPEENAMDLLARLIGDEEE